MIRFKLPSASSSSLGNSQSKNLSSHDSNGNEMDHHNDENKADGEEENERRNPRVFARSETSDYGHFSLAIGPPDAVRHGLKAVFASRHAHGAVWPIHDLILNDIFMYLIPTNPTTHLMHYLAVAAIIVTSVFVSVRSFFLFLSVMLNLSDVTLHDLNGECFARAKDHAVSTTGLSAAITEGITYEMKIHPTFGSIVERAIRFFSKLKHKAVDSLPGDHLVESIGTNSCMPRSLSPSLTIWKVWTFRLLTLLLLTGWTLYKRRVVWLAWHTRVKKWLFGRKNSKESANIVAPSATWMLDPTVVEVNRMPMHVPLRFHTDELDARKAACQPDLSYATFHTERTDSEESKTEPSAPSSPLTLNVWRIDHLDWQFKLFRSVQVALDTVNTITASNKKSQALLSNGNGHVNEVSGNNGQSSELVDTKNKITETNGTTDVASFHSIPVPANWMLQDNVDDIPIYTNMKYPFPCRPPFVPENNPTGLYKVDFILPSGDKQDSVNDSGSPSWTTAIDNGGDVTLLIHGAESCCYVFLNGQFIGFSKDSRLPAEFSITHALKRSKGEVNTLCIVVVRWSDGSYLEDQDHWWMAGLHRSVELCLRPPDADILDFNVSANAAGEFSCHVECRASLNARRRTVIAALYEDIPIKFDPTQPKDALTSIKKGRCVCEEEMDVDETLSCHLLGHVHNPKLWTAESPYLYTLVVTLLVNGKLRQVESCRVGFRTVEISHGQVLVNGKAITVCGINRHEHDPDTGKVVGLESMMRDIWLLKQNNFNAVRTCHYPNHPAFYRLTDYYGLYVCDEANTETHGMKPMGRLAHDWGWKDAFVTRCTRMVQRDRNHASVMFWSLGNESGRGRNLVKARNAVKKLDSSRPVCYESGGAIFEGLGRTELTDVVCPMYPDVKRTIRLGTRKDEDRPVILCEYSHAMGNSNGNLHLYWEAFWDEEKPRLQGGYIWDMIDQGLRIRDKTTADKFHFGYGGDFGDTINDLQFCINGMFSPDRHPHPAVNEVKYLQQPVMFALDEKKELGQDKLITVAVNEEFTAEIHFVVKNRYTFSDLSHLVWQWVITSNYSDEPFHVGAFEVTDGKVVITLDNVLQKIHEQEAGRIADSIYFINIRGALKEKATWADAGHILVTQQFPIKFKFFDDLTGRKAPSSPQSTQPSPLSIKQSDNAISVYRASMETSALAVIDKLTGSLISYCPFGENILAKGTMPNFTRAATDNDKGGIDLTLEWMLPGVGAGIIHKLLHGIGDFSYAFRWKHTGLSEENPPVIICSGTRVVECDDKMQVDITATCDVITVPHKIILFKVILHYRIYGDGRIRLSTHVVPQADLHIVPTIARVGLKLQLDPSLHKIQYYGLGPYENYPDRKSGSEMGVYRSSPADMGYLKYVVPGENGSRTDCEWISFRKDDGTGISIASAESGEPFCCSALLHSALELNNAAHTSDLELRDNGNFPIHVNIDHRLMGVGGDTSWFPNVYDDYLVKPTNEYTYALVFLPMRPNDNPAFLAKGAEDNMLAAV